MSKPRFEVSHSRPIRFTSDAPGAAATSVSPEDTEQQPKEKQKRSKSMGGKKDACTTKLVSLWAWAHISDGCRLAAASDHTISVAHVLFDIDLFLQEKKHKNHKKHKNGDKKENKKDKKHKNHKKHKDGENKEMKKEKKHNRKKDGEADEQGEHSPREADKSQSSKQEKKAGQGSKDSEGRGVEDNAHADVQKKRKKQADHHDFAKQETYFLARWYCVLFQIPHKGDTCFPCADIEN